MDADAEVETTEPVAPRKPGRPKGSRNKPKPGGYRSPFEPVAIPKPRADRVVDPMRLVDDQLRLLSWTQELLTAEIESRVDGKHDMAPEGSDVRKLADLSNAIARILEALKRSHDLADELAKRLSPEQLLEKALQKIEGQDVKTLNYAIRRLQAYRTKIAPSPKEAAMGAATAADAIASLEDE